MSHPIERYMIEAVALARENIARGGRPFGAVLVRDEHIIARGVNETHRTSDPTAHAELLALREAGRAANNPDLSGTVMYASGHPCPMCMAAMHLAGVDHVYFAYGTDDGAAYELSTADIYAEMQKPPQSQSLPLQRFRPEGERDLYADWDAHGRT